MFHGLLLLAKRAVLLVGAWGALVAHLRPFWRPPPRQPRTELPGGHLSASAAWQVRGPACGCVCTRDVGLTELRCDAALARKRWDPSDVRTRGSESRERPRVMLPCVGRGGFPFIRTSPCPGLLQTRGRRTPVLGPRARPSLSRRRQPAVPTPHLLAPAAHRTGPGGSRGSGGIYSRFPVSRSCG